MRCFGFLSSLFVLAGSVFGEVLNPPAGDYMIVDGHITSLTVSGDGSSIGFGFGLRVPNFSEAELVDRYIRSHVSSSCLEHNGYRGAYEVRNGQSNIVGGYVILVSQNYSDEDYDDILTAVRQCGYSVSDVPDYTYFDLGEAVISNDQPGDDDDDDDDDDDPPGLPPGAGPNDYIRFEYVNGQYKYQAGTLNGVEVQTGSLIHWCVGFHTADRNLAYELYNGLDSFYASYQWNYYSRPAGFSPHIHHVYEYENGEFLRDYYEVGIFEASGPNENHAAYMQFRYDYLASVGHFLDVSSPDFYSFYTPNTANPYMDNLTARSSLAGVQLAQGADSAGGVSYELPQGIVFSQSTNSGIDAAQGDFTGESSVRSTAEATTSGTTVNITNNTEITTNLELGDAPEADSYTADEAEEKEVADSDDLLTEEEPEYTYIDTSSTEYKIDYEKLWDDCKEQLDGIFGTDAITTFFQHTASGGYIEPWVISWVDPWIHKTWGFTVDVGAVANNALYQTLRAICNFGLYFATLLMSIRLFA